MNWADYSILIIVGISVAISVWRGFTREAFSLAGWIAAFWIAFFFSGLLAPLLVDWIEVPSLRNIVAFAALFLATLLVAGYINYLAVQIVKKTGLSGTDRMIGVFFGVARGCLVVAVLVLLGGMTTLPQDPWWGESHLLRYFERLALWLGQFLPNDIAGSIRFS